jgi:hypothetical protein
MLTGAPFFEIEAKDGSRKTLMVDEDSEQQGERDPPL